MLLVISSENTFDGEAKLIAAMFEDGLSTFHLRKPGLSKIEFEETLRQIPPKLYRKIVIHSHYELITKYNLGGVHFTNKFLTKTKELNVISMYSAIRSKGLTVSTSIHSLAELNQLAYRYNYVFLSPVFDSISKSGYLSQAKNFIGLKDHKTITTKVLGLGGISADNLNLALEIGFDGIAVLGAIWTSDNPVKSFNEIKNAYIVSKSMIN